MTASTILLITLIIEMILIALHATLEHNKAKTEIRRILDTM